MRRYLLSLLLLLLPSLASAAPRVGPEYIVLRTSAGDVVLALYPDVAPEHVRQLLHLTRLGVYDGTHFGRIEDGFVIQLSAAYERRVPFTPEQKAAIHPLKAEFSQLEHRRGILSMAHTDESDDSAETSFSVIVGSRENCRHLDGKYTIFGHVEAGMETFEKMLAVPRLLPPEPPVPLVPIELYKAEVVSAEQVHSIPLALPHEVQLSPKELADYRNKLQRYTDGLQQQQQTAQQEKDQAKIGTNFLVCGCLLVIVGMSLASFFFSAGLSTPWLSALTLLNILIGGFTLLILLGSVGPQHPTVATGVFFGMAAIFKLMSRFESV